MTTIIVPAGTPLAVQLAVKKIATAPLSNDQAEVLRRLATEPRMATVWKELARCSRETGDFLHPALREDGTRETEQGAQDKALAETLFQAFCAATQRVSVAKIEELELKKDELRREASFLRTIAERLITSHPGNAAAVAEAESIKRTAARWDDAITQIRGASDPLTISNDRGDRTVRGVQILIASFLQWQFGDSMDGTAATLTGVGLGIPTPSPKASQSALSRRHND